MSGRTNAMTYVMTHKTLAPRELWHEPSLSDGDGWTYSMYCMKYASKRPPRCMMAPPSHKNVSGYSQGDFFRIYLNREAPPKWRVYFKT